MTAARDESVGLRRALVRGWHLGMPAPVPHFEMAEGFRQLGVEVERFEWSDEIAMLDDERFRDLGPEVGVFGFVGDVWAGLKRAGRPRPAPIDYPEELLCYLGRGIHRTSLGSVRSTTRSIFVKPVEHKLFTGFVHTPDGRSRLRLVSHPDETEVWVSEVVDFVSEYRVFILREEIVDVRRYKGDWRLAPPTEFVEAAASAWASRPAACCLDFGATRYRGGHADVTRWQLVEANDGFSFGTYGLAPATYARMLAARWRELTGGAA